ncbi:hypothetical protein quinque_009799 [Culex quinquefasciatus]
MVFIHGGGYLAGSSHPDQFGPERFMDTRQVILVTFQYRLGAFGFLSTNDIAAPGNYGLKDQSLALGWVQRNIRAFDGAPDEVTLFGQSSGGSSVQLHMMSPLSKGLFGRAISMSGSALAGWNDPPVDPLSLVERQAEVAGVEDADTMDSWELVDALRKVDAVKLTESRSQLKSWNNYPIVLYTPVVEKVHEGAFMSEDPRELWRDGLYESVPWMTGYLPNDGAVIALGLISNHNLDRMIKLINEGNFLFPMLESILRYQNKPNSPPVSLYNFNFKSHYSFQNLYTAIPTTRDYGIVHGSELLYLFRIPAAFPDFKKDSSEEAMSREFVRQFVHFAVNGTLPSDDLKRKPSKCGGKLEIVEFTNSNCPNHPVMVNSLNCRSTEFNYLLDVLSWWSNKAQ